MRKFFKKDDGLVTIEWVGIAAVMVLAAIAITTFIMQGAATAGTDVATGLETAAQNSADGPAPTVASFQRGGNP